MRGRRSRRRRFGCARRSGSAILLLRGLVAEGFQAVAGGMEGEGQANIDTDSHLELLIAQNGS
jgi:hypothetical protein